MNFYNPKHLVPLTIDQLYILVPVDVRKRIDKDMFKEILDFWENEIEPNCSFKFDIGSIHAWHHFADSQQMLDYFNNSFDFVEVKFKSFKELKNFLDDNGFYYFNYKEGYICYDADMK